MKRLYNVRTLSEKNLTLTEAFMFEKNIKKQVNKQLMRKMQKMGSSLELSVFRKSYIARPDPSLPLKKLA